MHTRLGAAVLATWVSLGTSLAAAPARPEPATAAVAARTRLFYDVPLSCKIVRGQVCSNKALQVVLDVTRRLPDGRVLMRPDGRIVALEVDASRQEAARALVEAALRERELKAERLTGEREAPLQEALRAGPAWLDADALLRKTESGAVWFARKLVARVAHRHPVPAPTAETLSQAFSPILLKSLLAESFSRQAERAELLEAARAHLSAEALVALGTAYDAGLDTQLPEDPALTPTP